MKFDISVVLPVYNGAKTLFDSLLSMLNQKGVNYEIFIIDDGSTDNSFEIATRLINEHSNENVQIYQQKNKGLAKTLNIAIDKASSKYIARQDQDDISFPGRLLQQFNFLEQNQNVAMVGTGAQIYIENKPTDRFHNHPTSSKALKLELLFDNPFVHSSMMIRKNVLDKIGGYSEELSRQPPEDYELWSRIARKFEVGNLPDVLMIYKEMPSSMSRISETPFLDNVIKISAENLFFVLSKNYSQSECLLLSQIYHGVAVDSANMLSNMQMQQMLHKAALAISGQENNWSNEFNQSYKRISKHLANKSLSNKLPNKLLSILRVIKRLFI
jgi:glycosyltransferase involved in cell wall biosynthesis